MAARTARSRRDRGGSGAIGTPAPRARSAVPLGLPPQYAAAPRIAGASSAQVLAASISWSYCTPDGQAVMQAMQPRHRSKCSAAAAVPAPLSRIWVIRWIRPRGESISSPQSW